MAASINTIHVNDYVQIDDKEKGRVTSTVKPLRYTTSEPLTVRCAKCPVTGCES